MDKLGKVPGDPDLFAILQTPPWNLQTNSPAQILFRHTLSNVPAKIDSCCAIMRELPVPKRNPADAVQENATKMHGPSCVLCLAALFRTPQ